MIQEDSRYWQGIKDDHRQKIRLAVDPFLASHDSRQFPTLHEMESSPFQQQVPYWRKPSDTGQVESTCAVHQSLE
jgi:hypothetical protein